MEHLLEAAECAEFIPTQLEMSTDPSNHANCFGSANSANKEFAIENTQIFETTYTSEELNVSSMQPNPSHRDSVPKLVGVVTPTMRDCVFTFLYNYSLNSLRALGKASRTE